MKRAVSILLLLPILLPEIGAIAQQLTVTDYEPTVSSPRFDAGKGPLILVDESHNNFHTVSPTRIAHSEEIIPGRLTAFRDLVVEDGYRIQSLLEPFSDSSLRGGSILFISNALADANVESWALPNPSAFSSEEIAAVVNWVRNGGALLLIADHQPWPGAAEDLALALGLVFHNGYAFFEDYEEDWAIFSRVQGTLAAHAITRGSNSGEAIESVATFGGQAFRALPGVELEPLLVFPAGSELIMLSDPFGPEPGRDEIPRMRIDGMLQGAVMRLGLGRVAVFGEAAMFTAQFVEDEQMPMGMNHPDAKDNAQFVLNLLHWLSGDFPDS